MTARLTLLTTYAVVLALPPRVLSPNARHHWRVKAKAAKSYRAAACVAAWHTVAWNHPGRADPPKLERATITPTFHVRDRRGLRADPDNLIASIKPAIDGLRDAGLIAGDTVGQITLMSPTVIVDPESPRLMLAVQEVRP